MPTGKRTALPGAEARQSFCQALRGPTWPRRAVSMGSFGSRISVIMMITEITVAHADQRAGSEVLSDPPLTSRDQDGPGPLVGVLDPPWDAGFNPVVSRAWSVPVLQVGVGASQRGQLQALGGGVACLEDPPAHVVGHSVPGSPRSSCSCLTAEILWCSSSNLLRPSWSLMEAQDQSSGPEAPPT